MVLIGDRLKRLESGERDREKENYYVRAMITEAVSWHKWSAITYAKHDTYLQIVPGTTAT